MIHHQDHIDKVILIFYWLPRQKTIKSLVDVNFPQSIALCCMFLDFVVSNLLA